jgi:hypothetical protein
VGVAPAEAFSLSLVGRVVPLLALAPGGVLLLLAAPGRRDPPPAVGPDSGAIR